MVPWRVSPPPAIQPPPNDDEEDEQSDADEQESGPPQEFFADVRAILPNAGRLDVMKAWDLSRGIGAGNTSTLTAYDPSSARVQAALGFLFDDAASSNNASLASSVSSVASGSSAATSIEAAPKAQPLFRAASPSPPPALHAQRQVITLDSDDEIIVVQSPKKKVKLDKGKGKAKAVPSEIVELSDTDDEQEARPLSSLKSSPRPRPRRASPVPPPFRPPSDEDKVALVLGVIPDVDPSYVPSLLLLADGSIDLVVEKLLSSGGDYPKIKKAGLDKGKKRARDEEEEEEEVDWLNEKKGRGIPDVHYKAATLDQLNIDYDNFPVALIKTHLKANAFFYAPTYLALRNGDFQDQTLAKARPPKKKKPDDEERKNDELEAEKVWLRDRLLKEREERKRIKRDKKEEERLAKLGLLIECGCCFTDFRFETMVQCADAHLFCKECAVQNVHNVLGERKYALLCMADGCEAEFSLETISPLLKKPEIDALLKNRQDREVEEAGLEGLEMCPYCPFAVVIDNPTEKLLHCKREGCEKITCRECKKDEHLPLSCEEAKAALVKDKRIAARHAIEEEMSNALIRKCPRCAKPYCKADGCNHIVCESCKAHSCYICGKLTDQKGSYAHWTNSKCPQFDDTEKRNFDEVEKARKAAQAKLDIEMADDEIDPLKLQEPVRGAPILPAHQWPAQGHQFPMQFAQQHWGAQLPVLHHHFGGRGGAPRAPQAPVQDEWEEWPEAFAVPPAAPIAPHAHNHLAAMNAHLDMLRAGGGHPGFGRQPAAAAAPEGPAARRARMLAAVEARGRGGDNF